MNDFRDIHIHTREHRRSRVGGFFLFMLFVALLIPFSTVNASTPDPTEQLKPFIEKVIAILQDNGLKDGEKCNLCQRVIDVARERFDFQEMSKRVLGKHWKQISSEQQADFEVLFTRLLEHAYIGKIEEYAGQAVEYKKQRIRGERAEVQTMLVDSGKSIPVSYIMLLRGDQWMAYDVVIEGVSLVRNYKEQFDQIVSADGYEHLVSEIEKKIIAIEQGATGKE